MNLDLQAESTVQMRGAHYRITWVNGNPVRVVRTGINRAAYEGGVRPRLAVTGIERELLLTGPTAEAAIATARRQRLTPAEAYVHTPADPRLFIGKADDGDVSIFGETPPRVRVVRHGDAPTAEVQLRMYAGDSVASITDALTAEQCEATARALLDAAHHLRRHPSPATAPRPVSEGVPA